MSGQRRATKLKAYHWVVLGLSLGLTVFAYLFASLQVSDKAEASFDADTNALVAHIVERMGRYEAGLWGGVGAIKAQGADGDRISPAAWQRFATNLAIEKRYPGISGIGVVHRVPRDSAQAFIAEQHQRRPGFQIFPEHGEATLFPITLVEPLALNGQAIGLDIAHEANRRDALYRARDAGTSTVTGPIVLVQDAAQTAGFLFYAPFYEGRPTTLLERRAQFRGAVYAPFVVNELMAGALSEHSRTVSVRITDGSTVIYDELNSDQGRDPGGWRSSLNLDVYGRQWTFDFRSNTAFAQQHPSDQPILILVVGVVIDLGLLLLFWSLSTSNRRLASEVDQRVSAERALVDANQSLESRVHTRTEDLERINNDLQHFVYAASHDLKTPLRGIANLAEWLSEDHGGELSADGQNKLSMLRDRIERLDRLLDAMLGHARIGRSEIPPEVVDVEAALRVIWSDLQGSDGITLRIGSIPKLHTQLPAIELVFQNVLANARVHHHRDLGEVRVTAVEQGGFVTFEVSDDGPGIPAGEHDRVFELFSRLRSVDEVPGSGMGLALVRRQLRVLGGDAVIRSSPGQGTTVQIRWPTRFHISVPGVDSLSPDSLSDLRAR